MRKYCFTLCSILFGAFFPLNAGLAEDWLARSFDKRREAMVEYQLKGSGIHDPRVLEAMRKIKRHEFVPPLLGLVAYSDGPLPIGHGQTISQPYVVAYMTEALELKSGDRVLEIGTGSGYQAAVLGEIAKEVYSIEIVPELAARAKAILERLGYRNVHVKHGDGYQGWPEHAPFDAIILTAAPETTPPKLIDQLKTGGRLIAPVGEQGFQELRLITKTDQGVSEEKLLPVRFVPLVKRGRD